MELIEETQLECRIGGGRTVKIVRRNLLPQETQNPQKQCQLEH